MGLVINRLALFARHRGSLIPKWLRSFALRHICLEDARTAWWVTQDPFAREEPYSLYDSPYPFKLGIIKEFWHRHWPYVAACRDLHVAYRILDISGPDWIETVQNSGCDAFLVWPSVQLSVWKQMYDERLRIIVEDLGKIIYPGYHELWLYESKRRMAYWLEANNIPHAKTWIFYDKSQALEFANTTCLPIVAKTNMGARASGVQIFRDRKKLVKYVKSVFKKGIVHADGDSRDHEWGSILFQEYLPDVKEWRMIRIGDSYFGHQKLQQGDFHSGSGLAAWKDPTREVLNLIRDVTDKGRFQSMCLDVFQQGDRYLVNELQTYFGWIRPYQMMVNGKAGRYLYNCSAQKWVFEEGVFCQNGGCNLRIAVLMAKLGIDIELIGTQDLHLVSEEDRKESESLYQHNVRGESS